MGRRTASGEGVPSWQSEWLSQCGLHVAHPSPLAPSWMTCTRTWLPRAGGTILTHAITAMHFAFHPLSYPWLRSHEDLLHQGAIWEQSGEHSRAIDVYTQLTAQNCPDVQLLQATWEKVGCTTRDRHHCSARLLLGCCLQALDLAIKFVPERASDVAMLVSDRLAHTGSYVQAGELLGSVSLMKEALDMYMAGEAWDRAREMARNVAPRYALACMRWECMRTDCSLLPVPTGMNSTWSKPMRTTSDIRTGRTK